MVINKGSLVMSVTQSAANPSKSTLTHSELSMLLDVVEHTIHCYLNSIPSTHFHFHLNSILIITTSVAVFH